MTRELKAVKNLSNVQTINTDKNKYIDLIIRLDGALRFIGQSKFSNSNYLVISNIDNRYTWTISLEYSRTYNGYLTTSFKADHIFKVFDLQNRQTINLTLENFLELYGDVVEVLER